MKHFQPLRSQIGRAVWALAVLLAISADIGAQPTPAAVSTFDSYIKALELRLSQQHKVSAGFPGALSSGAPEVDARLRRGERTVEQLSPAPGLTSPGAMLHHWRGTAFVAGASASDFKRLMKDFGAYHRHFHPQVLRGRLLRQEGDHFQALLRIRQHHVLTVVMDMTYDINFGELDAQHGYSRSRSTQISEIDSPGIASERTLNANEEHGFLWRLNSYWSYAEQDGGLYMQIESVSLSRDIPHGLGWVIRPFVQSIPQESLEFTLRSTCNALRK